MNKGFFEPDPNTKSWVTLSHEEHEQLLKRNRVRGIFCLNGNCKHYFEDNCMKILEDDSIDISEDGTCRSFEEGVCDGYKEVSEK